jgi:glycosyltransferase involved in cell wall biosynthesis
MSSKDIDFTVIIPHRDTLHFLPKLFHSLPESDRIEILLIDNSFVPIKREDVDTDKKFKLLYSSPERGAGGARNEGLEHAHGKWLIFVDADDYLPEDAFEIFYNNFNSDADVIYFGMDGIYADTGERSDRGDQYTQLVKDYLSGKKSEMDLRLGFASPCSKMVRRELVDRHQIRFDEVVASNDVYFSLLTGYYATKIDAVDKITYIATVSRGSLTKRRDLSVVQSRFEVNLRRNKFLKEHNLSQYQASVMFFLFNARHFGYKSIITFIKLLVQYNQNPFIGAKRWFKTYLSYRNKLKKDKKYFTKHS